MLLRGPEILHDSLSRGTAIAGFVAYNLETAQGIVRAAEETRRPVLLMAGSSAFRHAGREDLATMCLALAARSPVEVGVHLDHCRSSEEVRACLALGYSSVMIDGSHLPYEENVALTTEIVTLAHQHGAWAEAELVGTPGDEDVSSDARAGEMTDPELARDFSRRTGIDALAVAVGNVHGYTRTEPTIDLERLEAIRDRTGLPLVLHGASGLRRETLRACVRRGVVKINVNTELRRAYLEAFSGALPAAREAVDLATPLGVARAAVAGAAREIVEMLAASGADCDQPPAA